MNKMEIMEIYFHKLDTTNGWFILLTPTIGLSRCKGKFIDDISIHMAWLYWNLEIVINLKNT